MGPNSDRWYWNTESIVRVQEFFGPSWELPFRVVTLLSDSGVVLILVAMIFWTLGRRIAYNVLAAVMTGALIITIIKFGIEVPRPEHVDLIVYESRTSPSFPSGHAMYAVAFWGMLAYLSIVREATALVVILVVMLSRMFLGIHYPADLAVGAAVGLLGILIGCVVAKHIFSRLTNQQMSLLIAAGFLGSVVITPIAGSIPFGWEVLGGLLGAGVGTLIESKTINYRPAPGPASAQLVRLLVGGGGVLFFVLIAVFLRQVDGSALLRTLVSFPLGLWAMLVTPYILDRFGLSESAQRSPGRSLKGYQT
jgi:membrane-associated phospholipid phosphatase